jgi:large subunit ribosomal protein L4
MQLDILSIKGDKTGRSIELPDDIFGIEPNDHVIYLAVKQYLAAQRQGTARVKSRAEVQGSSKKLHKQKGTGGARKGNIRNPLYRGGGIVHGPQPRDYSFKLNRKVKDLAKMSALAHKAKAGAIIVVEDMNLETPKTKDFATMLQAIAPTSRRSLFIIPEHNQSTVLSARNIRNVKTTSLSDINTYDLVNATTIVLSESAAKMFNEEEAPAEA